VVAGTHGGGPSQFKVQKVAHNDVVDDNVAATLDGYAVGTEYDKLNPGQQSSKFFSLVRPDADEPSPTIIGQSRGGAPGSIAGVAHPFERRKFTIGELKRISSFPDDFNFGNSSYSQAWERIGRAVPPVMMKKIAETLRDEVFSKIKEAESCTKQPSESSGPALRKASLKSVGRGKGGGYRKGTACSASSTRTGSRTKSKSA
jgi:hypothetical protein